jgi:hypothetical protein
MTLQNIIKEEYNKLILENNYHNSIPKDIKKLLDGYDLFMNFDWNDKQNEFADNPDGFINWFNNHQNKEFKLKINELISKVRNDIILKHKQNLISKKLKYFEELIKPVLGNEVLIPALNKYEEIVLLDPNATIDDIERGFKEAKNIIDRDGSINIDKVTISNIFKGGEISLPAFESFSQKNQEYKGVFNDWKKIFDEDIELTLVDTNTSQIISINDMRKLYNYLVNIKKEMNASI